MGKKVIVAGHICLDITPVFPQRKVRQLGDVLQPGKLIHMREADVHAGGAVTNTGLAMKILGADVRLMGKIGDDAFGEMVMHILEQYDAKDDMLIAEGESTSYSVILAVPGIDRVFLHNPGSNDTFRAENIPAEILEGIALFHFGYPPLMRKMYENDGKELLTIFKRAKSAGAATSMDMASVDPVSGAGQADWEMILKRVLPYVDFFVPSVEELCFMLDKKRFAKWQERAAGGDITEMLDIEKDVRPLADRCMALGAKVLLIKCGAPGLYYRTADRSVLANVGSGAGLNVDDWSGREGFERSYVPDQILSGTGAGDTSIAAFLTAMLDGEPIEECMRLAAATGASCVAAYDALSGLKPFSELKAKMKAGWRKCEERSNDKKC